MKRKFYSSAALVFCATLLSLPSQPAWTAFLPVTGGPVFGKPSCAATVEGAFCAINGQTATVPRQTALLVTKCNAVGCNPLTSVPGSENDILGNPSCAFADEIIAGNSRLVCAVILINSTGLGFNNNLFVVGCDTSPIVACTRFNDLGAIFTGDPSCTSFSQTATPGPGTVLCGVKGNNGALYVAQCDAALNCSAIEEVGGIHIGNPSCASSDKNVAICAIKGTNSQLFATRCTPGTGLPGAPACDRYQPLGIGVKVAGPTGFPLPTTPIIGDPSCTAVPATGIGTAPFRSYAACGVIGSSGSGADSNSQLYVNQYNSQTKVWSFFAKSTPTFIWFQSPSCTRIGLPPSRQMICGGLSNSEIVPISGTNIALTDSSYSINLTSDIAAPLFAGTVLIGLPPPPREALIAGPSCTVLTPLGKSICAVVRSGGELLVVIN